MLCVRTLTAKPCAEDSTASTYRNHARSLDLPLLNPVLFWFCVQFKKAYFDCDSVSQCQDLKQAMDAAEQRYVRAQCDVYRTALPASGRPLS